MKNSTDTRDRIVAAGLEQLLAHGYEGTGIGPLLASVKVPKGSFYHFFASKEAFAEAVLDAYGARNRAIRAEIFADRSRSPMTRLADYFALAERDVLAAHPYGACLYGTLAQSAPAFGEALRERLTGSLSGWEDAMATLLGEAQAVGEIPPDLDPTDAAAFLVDAYEGTVLRARMGDGAAAFRRFRTYALGALTRSATA